MEPTSIKEILDATGGKLLSGDPSSLVTSICVDNRELKKNSLFLPLIGERVDGHKFIKEALSGKAMGSFTQNESFVKVENKAMILVKNTLKALHDIARYYRKRFDLPLIAVTGSVGKTITKEMIFSILSQKFDVMKTEGNLNSQVGLPLTLLNLNHKNQAAVVEFGISEPGEMEKLVKMALPNISVITNIGLSHIEFLKSKENIFKEKLHISDTLSKDDILLLNGDDKILFSAKDIDKKILYFGLNKNNDLVAEEISINNGAIHFSFKNREFSCKMKINVLGKYNLYSALVGIGIALRFNLSTQEIQRGLENYSGVSMRQQIHRNKELIVINDTYNSSPDSVVSAVETMEEISNSGRKIAVLADMLELGEFSEKEHYNLGVVLSKSKIDALLTIGKFAKNIAIGFEKNNDSKIKTMSFLTNEEAFFEIEKIISPKDVILIKGSRGMKTEEIVQKILELQF
ncbi:MAG: UDP-N-acetylmuramoyl-tripeptide--D-alanyl-D-alanine ligase [Oscillospiraceae bacterium]|jgi:UDP-N-acetylmuramoyl-tripeptide--D-alanyl-D-alanine ligase|nr:UDP-N-acetylmuramoyl-tripeptide--D-alanyl-D-alanine ligase [Oscillospiraceae bacterium]